MQTSPRIIFVTTCRGRLQHLAETLPQNIADNINYANCKFIVLDYSSRDGLEEYLKSFTTAHEAGYLAAYTYLTDGPFHVSHAKNMAMRCAILEGADILVTLDADNYTGPGFAQFIAKRFEEHASWPGMFLCPNFPLIKSLPHGPLRPDRGYAGRLAIQAKDFVKMGAYDESFDTWHGEDIDMISRLGRLSYSMRYIDNCYLKTIPHGPDVRFKEYPHAKQFENKNEWAVIDSRTTTVVNYGKWGVGRVFKNYDFTRAIELEPLPTRIFGIGMHKTGTTTLHHALRTLGYDSFHWGAGEAPHIWNEMELNGRSPTLEQWYALSDLPIPLLYKELDQAYPGSKYILTIRNERDWLRSVARLWDAKYNPTRWMWDVYPFTNRIHRELYGQKHFSSQTMLERYRRHNAEVREYFKNRPDDLLIMNIDQKPGWPVLCGFLDVPVPSVPYPYSNPTTANHEYKKLAQSESYCDPETTPVVAAAAAPDIIFDITSGEKSILPAMTPIEQPGGSPAVTGGIRSGQYGDSRDEREMFVPTTMGAKAGWSGSWKMIDAAKVLASIPSWRDLDFVRRNYRLIIIFVLSILFGLLVGVGLARLIK